MATGETPPLEPLLPDIFEVSSKQLKSKFLCDRSHLEHEIKLLAARLDKDGSIHIKRLS